MWREQQQKKACKEQLSVIDVLTKVFCDLLLNRPTAKRSLFVLYDKKQNVVNGDIIYASVMQ